MQASWLGASSTHSGPHREVERRRRDHRDDVHEQVARIETRAQHEGEKRNLPTQGERHPRQLKNLDREAPHEGGHSRHQRSRPGQEHHESAVGRSRVKGVTGDIARRRVGQASGHEEPGSHHHRERRGGDDPSTRGAFHRAEASHARGEAPTFCVNARENAGAVEYPSSIAVRETGTPARSMSRATVRRHPVT